MRLKIVTASLILLVSLLFLFQNCSEMGSFSGSIGQTSLAQNPDAFTVLFPRPLSMAPDGQTYSDTVPDTIDLADRAALYIQGVTQTANPNQYYAPQAASLNPAFSYDGVGPKFTLEGWGAPNWGEVMLALSLAREMTGFDRDNSKGTWTTQYEMMKNMLDPDANRAVSTNIVQPVAAVTPTTYAMMALHHSWKQRPTSSLLSSIDDFLKMHQNVLRSEIRAGREFFYFYNDKTDFGASSVGDLGSFNMPFVQGVALGAFVELYQDTRNQQALQMAYRLTDYLLNYENSVLWGAGGEFNGHIYSWLEAARGLLLFAKVIQAQDPVRAEQLIRFVNGTYSFIKNRTQAGWVGNFGSTGTTANMAITGLMLSQLGAGDYYDEIEAWTRNQLTESQIDELAAERIPSQNDSRWQYDQVGKKVKGLFFGDATHVLSIPDGSQAFTTDDHAMSFRGLHAVWNHIVQVKGSDAYVNIHMNRASRYLDVKSEIPYRGQVEIITKQDIGPIRNLYIRIPTYLSDRSTIQLRRLNADGSAVNLDVKFAGPYGHYVYIDSVAARTKYILYYPVPVLNLPVVQMRANDHVWYECSHTTTPGQQVQAIMSGVFRGTTLVHVNAETPAGIPRYSQSWRKDLYNLKQQEIEAPQKNKTQFIYIESSM